MGRRGGNKQGKGKGKGKGRQAGERGGGAGEEESSRSDSRLNPKYGAEREWRCDNLLFSLFYQALGLVDASEWDGLVAAMSRDLPASFRVNSLCTHAKQVKEDLMTLDETMIEVDGKKVAAGKCIEWYPDQMAYKLIVDKRKMKKLPELAEYTKVVQLHTESGAISRLEEVSMVPPRFLDVRSGMTVLDMCASPGSKTFQLIEMLMASEREEEGKVCHSRSIVVANDVNKDRCYLLSHQLKRLSYPGLCVTCCPGQNFPNISLPGSGEAPHDDSSDSGFFDRVLCDVPCSGDGTIRKLPDVWHKWDTKNSIGVHSLQVDITLRGLEVTKVGGLLVYSTCSLSPYENEAVVAELLRRQKGSVELVDVSSLYPLLKRRPGKASWKVIPITREDRSKYVRNEETDMQLVEDPLQALKDIGIPVYSAISEVPSDATMQLSASLFPPSEQESAAMHLDRCMRFVHSDQDTGGFFVAVLRKTGSIKSRVMPKATENAKPPPKKKTKSRGGGNNPATQLVHVEAGVTDLLKEKFGLLDSFSMDNLVSHHTGARGMWFCNDTVTAAIINSEVGSAKSQKCIS
jgi:16S rRNA C967 or C1407 C5-methylase (RsmB/RsmF family)